MFFQRKWEMRFFFGFWFFYMRGLLVFVFVRLIYITEGITYLYKRSGNFFDSKHGNTILCNNMGQK
jgi:hypothetical protein